MKTRVLPLVRLAVCCLSGSVLGLSLVWTALAAAAGAPRQPLHRTLDLDIGEAQQVTLWDGTPAKVKLIGVSETRDALRSAVRRAEVRVEVNGTVTNLVSGNYHLPVTLAGVQIDCPVTRGYRDQRNHRGNVWALEKSARLRVWPAGSPWIEPGSFTYLLRTFRTQAGQETWDFGDGSPAVERHLATRRLSY